MIVLSSGILLIFTVGVAAAFGLANRSGVAAVISLIVGVAFGAGTSAFGPVRYVLAGLCGIGLILMMRSMKRGWALATPLLCLISAAVLLVMELSDLSAGEKDAYFRLIVLFPSAFLLGCLLTVDYKFLAARALATWGILYAAVAAGEYLAGVRLFQTGLVASFGDLSFRAGGAAEHSLVLAVLVAMAAPMIVATIRTRSARFFALLICAIGILATGAVGPLVLVLTYVSAHLLKVDKRISQSRALPVVLTVAVLSASAVGFFLHYTDPVITAIGGASSELYRLVLYAVVVPSLTIAPLGWGIGGLPTGQFLIPTAYGVLDLARTIDSEFVLLAVEFGILGMLVAIVLIWAPWFREGMSSFRWSSFLFLASGAFVSLHSWAGLGTLGALVLGLSMSAATRTPARTGVLAMAQSRNVQLLK